LSLGKLARVRLAALESDLKDDFAIRYYYREGTTREEALRDERFRLDFYEKGRELVKLTPGR
jgi:hypothetical protein